MNDSALLTTEWLKENCLCCACGDSLKESPHISGICLDREAYWKFPIWGNVFVEDGISRAVAFVCDTCISQKKKPSKAIEFGQAGAIIYHAVDSLPESPRIEPPMRRPNLMVRNIIKNWMKKKNEEVI